MSHTPGPWHQAGLETKDSHWMRDVRDAEDRSVAWCGRFPIEEAHANARLIAAAPRLLNALYAILEGMEASGGWEGDDELFNEGMAAYREAMGRKQGEKT